MTSRFKLLKYTLLILPALLFKAELSAQVNCDDLLLNSDSLWVEKDRVFTGACVDYNNKHVTMSTSYITKGIEDSVIFFYKNGVVKSTEHYKNKKQNGTFKKFYKNGVLKQSIQLQNNEPIGFWREYDEQGKIRYEAEYISAGTLKDNAYYKWTKSGEKYKYTVREVSGDKKTGRIRFDLGMKRRPLKTKVTE